MIPGLLAVVRERGLAKGADLHDAVLGVAGTAVSVPGALDRVLAAARGAHSTIFVVLDGPGAATTGRGERELVRALSDRGVPWMRAPARASRQLLELHHAAVVSHVLGLAEGSETWLFGDVPLVLELDPKPLVATRSALLAALNIPAPAFVECCVGAGCSFSHPASLLEVLVPNESGLVAAVKVSAMAGGFYRAATTYDPEYVPVMQKALAAISWQMYLDENGGVVLSNKSATVPQDIYEVVGHRLPDEYFWYARTGLVGPELLRALMWGQIDDPSPTAGAAVADYASLQAVLAPLRHKAIGLLAQPIHRYFQFKTITDNTQPGTSIKPSNFVHKLQPPESALSSPGQIAQDCQQRALELADLAPTLTPDEAAAALLNRAHVGDTSLQPAAIATLRLLAEAVAVCRFSLRQADHTVDPVQLLATLPWGATPQN